jgi:flagellar biosynthesis protein FlhB
LVGREIVVEIIWVWLSHFLGDGDFFPKFFEGGTDIEFKKKNVRREEKRNEPKPEMKICQNERKNETKRKVRKQNK